MDSSLHTDNFTMQSAFLWTVVWTNPTNPMKRNKIMSKNSKDRAGQYGQNRYHDTFSER